MAKVVKFGESPAPEYRGPDLPEPRPYEFPEGGYDKRSPYSKEIVEKAVILCEEFGATDAQLSKALGVSRRVIRKWKENFPDFRERIEEAKALADSKVERSLFERATGYNYPAKKIFQYKGEPVIVDYTEHVPPDVQAQESWLKRRDPDAWLDVSRVEHTGPQGTPLPIINITLNQGAGAPLEISANPQPQTNPKVLASHEPRPFLDMPKEPKVVEIEPESKSKPKSKSIKSKSKPDGKHKAKQRVRPPED